LAKGFVRASELTSCVVRFDKELLREQLLERCRKGLGQVVSPRPWALPLVPIWAAVSVVRHWLYDRKLLPVVRLSVPVIAVGSTNARGSGKTPAAIMMATELRRRGHRVGVAVRGYRRVNQGTHVALSTDSMCASELGDEGALIASKGFLVAAGPRRVSTAQALEGAGATVVVFEDGLGHRRLHRDIDIAIVDGRNLRARGLIPAGERREWQPIPARVDGVLCQYADESSLPAGAVPVRRMAGGWHHGDTEIAKGPSGDVALFLGVGRPGDFVRDLALNIGRSRIFGDHEPISEETAQEILTWAAGLPIVCTAKDRVRLPPGLFDRVWWRDVVMTAEDLPESWFLFSPLTEVATD
jgi:tetraacyldisaccharide 4'-kinase